MIDKYIPNTYLCSVIVKKLISSIFKKGISKLKKHISKAILVCNEIIICYSNLITQQNCNDHTKVLFNLLEKEFLGRVWLLYRNKSNFMYIFFKTVNMESDHNFSGS